ncbi:MAG TPA: hypothetical protein PLB62_12220, partial [Candidatus Sumerlaeota bacterium]|nr:hypothetical protein [Candidatus Sumerlaeota bacterium]
FFYKAFPRIRGMMGVVRERFEMGATFSNIQVGHVFFMDYFRRNLTAFSFPFSFFERTLAWGAFVLLGAGVAAGFRRRPWMSLIAIISIAGTFVLIFNLKAERFFHMRYLSALLPLYAVFMACGAVHLADMAGFVHSDHKNGSGSRGPSPITFPWILLAVYIAGIVLSIAFGWERSRPWTAWAGWLLYGLVFAWAALCAGSFRFRLIPEKLRRHLPLIILAPVLLANLLSIAGRMNAANPNYKRIVEIWKQDAQTGDPVVFQSFGEWEPLRYYLPQAGLSLRDAIRLNDTKGEVGIRLAQLRGLARTLDRGWFSRSWDIDLKTGIIDWANSHLPFVEYAPSSFGKDMDIRLFRLNVRDSYLNAPYGLRLQYNDRDPRRTLDDGRILYERQVDVDGASLFTVSLPRDSDPVASGTDPSPEIFVDGRLYGTVADIQTSGGITLTDGRHALGAAAETLPPPLLWNTLDLPDGVVFPARALTIPFHSFVAQKEYQGRPALVLSRNVGVEYWFDFPAPGVYELSIEAVHDKGAYDRPRPVWLDISVDDQFQGILPFERRDNTWDARSMPISIPSSGMHSLGLNLVSGALARWNLAPDEEINAILGNITIVRTPGHLQPRDERLSAGPPEAGGPRTIPVPVVDEKDPLKTFPDWQFVTAKPSNIHHEAERTLGLWKAPAVEMEVPHDSTGIIVLGPLRPLPASSLLVHASALLQTYDLVNHSATLGLAFFGENPSAGILPESPVIGAQEGILRQAGPSRFSVASRPAPGARRR